MSSLPWDRITVEKIIVKEGAKDGRPWKRTALKDKETGDWLSTFSEPMVEGVEEGKPYEVQYETKVVNGQSLKNLIALRPLETSSNGAPSYSHTKPTGEADWDKKDLTISRCGLWNSFLRSDLANSVYVRSDGKVEPLLRIGAVIVAGAEKDIYERPPGDDAYPFLDEPPAGGDIPI